MVQNRNGHLFCLVFAGLGPLLFFLYINDIMVGKESEICLFADDCVCYRQIDSIEDTSKLQKDIDQLENGVRDFSP